MACAARHGPPRAHRSTPSLSRPPRRHAAVKIDPSTCTSRPRPCGSPRANSPTCADRRSGGMEVPYLRHHSERPRIHSHQSEGRAHTPTTQEAARTLSSIRGPRARTHARTHAVRTRARCRPRTRPGASRRPRRTQTPGRAAPQHASTPRTRPRPHTAVRAAPPMPSHTYSTTRAAAHGRVTLKPRPCRSPACATVRTTRMPLPPPHTPQTLPRTRLHGA